MAHKLLNKEIYLITGRFGLAQAVCSRRFIRNVNIVNSIIRELLLCIHSKYPQLFSFFFGRRQFERDDFGHRQTGRDFLMVRFSGISFREANDKRVKQRKHEFIQFII